MSCLELDTRRFSCSQYLEQPRDSALPNVYCNEKLADQSREQQRSMDTHRDIQRTV